MRSQCQMFLQSRTVSTVSRPTGLGKGWELQQHPWGEEEGHGPRSQQHCSRRSYHGLAQFHSCSRKAGSMCHCPHFTDEEK